MKTTDWDRVVTSAPMNKDAALARDGKGVGWRPDAVLQNTFENPPPSMPNLVGKRFGRLTGVFLAHDPDREQHKWIFRCDCGRYTVCGSRTVERQVQFGRAHCGECDYLRGIQKGFVTPPKERGQKLNEMRERKLTEREEREANRARVNAIAHPVLQETTAALIALGLSPQDVVRSMSQFNQIESARLKALEAEPEQT